MRNRLPNERLTFSNLNQSFTRFRIESTGKSELGRDFRPNGNGFEYLELPQKGRAMSTGGSVGVYHPESGKPMLVAADESGGLIDHIEYYILDESGENNLRWVIDYEADGQADLRVNAAERFFEIWHNDSWHRTEERDGKRGIVVDGGFVEIEMRNNRWVVP